MVATLAGDNIFSCTQTKMNGGNPCRRSLPFVWRTWKPTFVQGNKSSHKSNLLFSFFCFLNDMVSCGLSSIVFFQFMFSFWHKSCVPNGTTIIWLHDCDFCRRVVVLFLGLASGPWWMKTSTTTLTLSTLTVTMKTLITQCTWWSLLELLFSWSDSWAVVEPAVKMTQCYLWYELKSHFRFNKFTENDT